MKTFIKWNFIYLGIITIISLMEYLYVVLLHDVIHTHIRVWHYEFQMANETIEQLPNIGTFGLICMVLVDVYFLVKMSS